MQLPSELSAATAELVARIPPTDLKRAVQQLSHEYRSDAPKHGFGSDAQRLAYLAVRMPATYVAVRSALARGTEFMQEFAPATLLDLGAGPGTALWAACAAFPRLQKLAAVERDSGLISIGRELASASANEAIRQTEWRQGELRSWELKGKYDIVVASYALGELSAEERGRVLLLGWEVCGGMLVVVEAGTRKGFQAIAGMRDLLIRAGATLAAPCPHAGECPMLSAGDWCHFSARLERSSKHRRLKEAELGYEDEKYSYVVASRLPVKVPDARIVRHPMRYSGFTQLTLCTADGLKNEVVTRSQKERYREAKRSEWGSEWQSQVKEKEPPVQDPG